MRYYINSLYEIPIWSDTVRKEEPGILSDRRINQLSSNSMVEEFLEGIQERVKFLDTRIQKAGMLYSSPIPIPTLQLVGVLTI